MECKGTFVKPTKLIRGSPSLSPLNSYFLSGFLFNLGLLHCSLKIKETQITLYTVFGRGTRFNNRDVMQSEGKTRQDKTKHPQNLPQTSENVAF